MPESILDRMNRDLGRVPPPTSTFSPTPEPEEPEQPKQESILDRMNRDLGRTPPPTTPAREVPSGQVSEVSKEGPTGRDYFLTKTPEGKWSSRFLQDITPVRGFPKMQEGFHDIGSGEYARGINKVVEGGVQSAAVPLAATGISSLIAAPLATAAEVVGGGALAYGVEHGAKAAGATPEQAELAGNVAGLVPIASTVARGAGALRSRFGGEALREAEGAAARAAGSAGSQAPTIGPPVRPTPPEPLRIPIQTAPPTPAPPLKVEAIPATKAAGYEKNLDAEAALARFDSLVRDLQNPEFIKRAGGAKVRELGMEAESLARYLQKKEGQDPQLGFEFAEQLEGRPVRRRPEVVPDETGLSAEPLPAPGLTTRTRDPLSGRIPTEDLSARLASGDEAAAQIPGTEGEAQLSAIRAAERRSVPEGVGDVEQPWDYEISGPAGKRLPLPEEAIPEAPWDFVMETKPGQPFGVPREADQAIKDRLRFLQQQIKQSGRPIGTTTATQEPFPWINQAIDNPPQVATHLDPRTGKPWAETPESAIGESLTTPGPQPEPTAGVLQASPEAAASTTAALRRLVSRFDSIDRRIAKLQDRRQFTLDSEAQAEIDSQIAKLVESKKVTPDQETLIRSQLEQLEAFTPEELQRRAIQETTKPKPRRGFQAKLMPEPPPFQREEFAASVPRKTPRPREVQYYDEEGTLLSGNPEAGPVVPRTSPLRSPGSRLAPDTVQGAEGAGVREVAGQASNVVPPGAPGTAPPAPDPRLPVPPQPTAPPRSEGTTAPLWTRGLPSWAEVSKYLPEIGKKFLRARDIHEAKSAQMMARLDRAGLNDLSSEEQRNLFASVERKAEPMNDRVRELVDVANEVKSEIAQAATKAAPGEGTILIKSADGSHYAFTGRADYMPHQIPSLKVLKDKSNPVTQEIVQNMVERGVPGVRTQEEAAGLIDEWVAWMDNKGNPDRMVRYLIATKQAQTEAQAIKRLKFYRQATMNSPRIQGSLERARLLDLPFYDPNSTRVLHNYVREANARLAHISEFGQNDEILDKMIQAVRVNNGDEAADRLKHVVDNIAGKGPSDSRLQDVSVTLRQLSAFKITPITAVPNMFQATLFGLLKTDYPTVMSALKKVGGDWAGTKARALESGAFTETTIRQVLAEEGIQNPGKLQSILNVWMNTGFAQSERSQRHIAQAIGEEYAQKLVTGMYNNLNKPTRFRHLMERFTETSWTEPAELLARIEQAKAAGADPRSILSNEELLQSGKMMSDMLNFRSSAIDNPADINNPVGHLIWQFKNYLYHSTRLQYNEIANSLNRGVFQQEGWAKLNPETYKAVRNLISLAVVFPMAGAVTTFLRDTLREGPTEALASWDDQADNPLKAYLRSAGQAGVLSAAGAVLESSGYGKLAETVIGPTGSTVLEGAEAAVRDMNRVVEKEGKEARPYSLAQFITKNVPLVGTFVYPRIKDQIKEAIQGGPSHSTGIRGRSRGRGGRGGRRRSSRRR